MEWCSCDEMSELEAFEIYRNRDAVEKIFRMDKSYLGNEKLEGKMFVSVEKHTI